MRFFVTGLSHHTAPLEVRESLAKVVTPVHLALRRFLGIEALEQIVIISTCNRVELYVCCSGLAQDCVKLIWEQVLHETGLRDEELSPHLYTHYGPDAFSHLFRVSSSLDSMARAVAAQAAAARAAAAFPLPSPPFSSVGMATGGILL